MDRSDRILLTKMQEDATLSLERLADVSNLSIPSVQRRLKQLRKKNVIDREVAVLNPAALGQKMTFVIMVELERESLEQLDAFRLAVRKEERVQQCYYVTGEGDFALICIVRDMGDFENLTHSLFFNNSNVRRFRTSVVMERTKVSLSVPLDTDT
ncbi:Lrp/AsnC family transcriptional regulator [Paraglaciecola sp.]|uniref:Lrp/AsnC family transcriptional regulator n=1 Tax=Paraglaciecola sp. TaxID=1920173 RepID=UPI0030F409F9